MTSLLATASCMPYSAEEPVLPQADMSDISAVCSFDTRLPKGATKAMDDWAAVDQITTRKLDANFLRIHEDDADNKGTGTFSGNTDGTFNWGKAYLSEATVISSPDNTADIHYRSILFSPRQAYKLYSEKITESVFDTTAFFHTRMVGWYPLTNSLPVHDLTQLFENTDQTETHEIGGHTYKAIKFTGLDGARDIMVSNVCEGQHWHSRLPSKSVHTEDSHNLPYRHPFGHYQTYNGTTQQFSTRYSNFFKFRHYLSGVRIWAFVPEQGNTHALEMWGNITDVVLLDQPTSVCITLPEEPLYDANANSLSWDAEAAHFNDPQIWGQAYGWGDFKNMSVQTGPMFGDDTNHNSENYTVNFDNLSMKGVGDKDHAMYLGYSLIKPEPENGLEIEIHTRYGIYSTIINRTYNYRVNGEDKQLALFKPGYYYDVYLSLQTDGTISSIIETRGNEKYYDLTRSVSVSPTGSPENRVTTYKYANCYIIDPADDEYDKTDHNGICDYSGFFFNGMVAGNGPEGILNYNGQSFYPASADLGRPVTAHLVWESSRSLITNVELINGYVKFNVPGITDSNSYTAGEYKDERKGNAVIGVFDGNGTCLWSWHIWITDKPGDLTYNGTVTVMDRNLGATFGGMPDSAEKALASYGLYYQWGRKDPSVGPPSWNYSQKDSETAVFYDYSSDPINSTLPVSLAQPSLKDAVEHPMYPILPTTRYALYSFDWLHYGPENILWGYDNSAGKAYKTIYDPCPFGYKVPTGELKTVMTSSTGYSKGTYGINYTESIEEGGSPANLFFPFAGYKGVDKGQTALTLSWSYVGKKGDYQEGKYSTASGVTMYHRARVYISSDATWKEDRANGVKNYTYGTQIKSANGSNVFIDWTNRRTAASVRCVKDTSFDVHP